MVGIDYLLLTTVVYTMNEVKNSLQNSDRSWSIHIYNGRRLLCSLYPSHAWIFFLGATLSGLLIAAGLQLSNCVAQPTTPSSTQPNSPTSTTPALQVD